MIKRPIATRFAPNLEFDDFLLSLKEYLRFWEWRKNEKIEKLKAFVQEKFKIENVFFFDSGRSSFFVLLSALDFSPGDEIIVQGFTCVSLLWPIIEKKLRPVFCDIDETLNLDPEDLEKKISPKTRAVVLQHTFGFPAKIKEIKEICKKHHLFLIEDCAHSLGAKYQNDFLGKFGDFAFFSFSRDKVLSSVFGGMLWVKDKTFAKKIEKIKKTLPFPSFRFLSQILNYNIFYFLFLPFFDFFSLGKFFLKVFSKANLFLREVFSEEKKAKKPKFFPQKFSSLQASLIFLQFKKLNRFNEHRKKIAKIYESALKDDEKIKIIFKKIPKGFEPIFLRYPVLVESPQKILNFFKKRKIYLEDGWQGAVILPKGADFQKFFYQKGSCPRAEFFSKKILNLPTNIFISEKDAKKIVYFLKKFK